MAYWLDRTGIITVSNQLRQKGNKIVLTHGTFDLFHIGHLDFLERSKKLGDILIVGVDQDDWVTYLKGKDRPIIPAELRVKVLSGIKPIDFIFITGEKRKPTDKYYLSLYAEIRPNVITYGRQFPYSKQFHDVDRKYKIKFVEIPDRVKTLNSSTSKIILKIKST